MKTTNSGSWIIALLILQWITNAALACDRAQLEGVWTRFVPSQELANAGTKTIWKFHANEFESITQLTDDVTVSRGGDDPYFESQTTYAFSLDSSTCILTGTANFTTNRSYRVYDEPTEAKSEERVFGTKKVIFKVAFSKSGSQATFDDGVHPPLTMTREGFLSSGQ